MSKKEFDEKDVKKFFEELDSDIIKSYFCVDSKGFLKFGSVPKIVNDADKIYGGSLIMLGAVLTGSKEHCDNVVCVHMHYGNGRSFSLYTTPDNTTLKDTLLLKDVLGVFFEKDGTKEISNKIIDYIRN